MLFDYVGSGMSFTRIVDVDVSKSDSYIKRMNILLDGFNENHKYIKHSLLYNAFAEPKFPEIFKNYHNSLYSDSGGLQVITRGAEITDEVRQKIYETQSEADYAFCFDKIPVISQSSVGRIINNQKRFLIVDKIKESGQVTGGYIKEQIEKFAEMNAKTKVFMIIQGQEVKDFEEFFGGIMDVLPKEYLDKIEGLAPAGSSSGIGLKFDINRALAVAKLDLPERIKKRVHILGAGALNRVIIQKFILEKLIPGTIVSFDSSTHTRLATNGVYYGSGDIFTTPVKKISLPKLAHHNIKEESIFHHFIAEDIMKMLKELDIDIQSLGYKDKDDLYKWIKINEGLTKTKFLETYDKKDLENYIFIDFLRYMGSVYNFGNDLGNIVTTGREIEYLTSFKKLKFLSFLKDAKTYEDFDYFLKHFGKELVEMVYTRIPSEDHLTKQKQCLF